MSAWSGPELPTGTLTFLFTDVEGSTRLWEQHPQAMRDVMARHDAMLTAAFERHDGVVVRPRGEGDSLFCVFIRASDAAIAAMDGQRALVSEDWGEVGPLRVRMGLHTGEADLRDGDYYGSAVNRCARIRAAGHGCQILLSEATARLVRGALPADAELVELGHHRLRGLSEPELIFQLSASDIVASFPPLATLDLHPNNLPLQLTSFLGREREIAEVTLLLREHRLVTLSGTGGTGKTRLALAAAAQMLDAFPDGVWFVNLSGVREPSGVIPAIAQVLNVREGEGRSLAVSLAAYLRRKRLLLVLDNFEQVVDAAVSLYDLLAAAPALSLLVTSRTLLRIQGEQEYAVLSLPLPDAGSSGSPDEISPNPAVQLFVERAQALRSDFAITAENAAVVSEICRRLDGLPLAIELAAARVKLLSPAALLSRLDQRLPLLTGGERNRPQRQQMLRATIQWSWDLLRQPEQILFRRLAVFAGGFTLEAAEAVCNPVGELDVLSGLATLVDHCLIRQHEERSNGATRFTMLATLQEFALEQLESASEVSALRWAHATYYTMLAETADAAWWRSGHLHQDLFGPLDPERDNIFASLIWAIVTPEAELGLRLGGALAFWFYLRASGRDQGWLVRLLGLPEAAAPTTARGRVLWSAGASAIARGEPRAAAAYLEDAAACLRVAEDLPALGRALALLGVMVPAEETDRAQQLAEEGLRLARVARDAGNLAFVEEAAGLALLWHGGNRGVVRGHLEEAIQLARSINSDWLTMFALDILARLARLEGQHEEAWALWHDALPLAESLGDRAHAVSTRLGLAQLAATSGEWGEAAEHWRRALALAQDFGSTPTTAICLTGLAGSLHAQRRFASAVQLLATSDRLREAVEHDPLYGPWFQAAFVPALKTTKAVLSSEAFAQMWAAGQALSLDRAVDLALAERVAPSP